MFYRVVQKNTLLPFVLLPFFMVLAWGKTLFFVKSALILHDSSMPLYEIATSYIAGHSIFYGLTTLLMAFLVMFGLNRFNVKYVLLKKQSMIPGIAYLILVSGYTYIQQLHPVWFFVPFLVWAIDKLFNMTNQKEPALSAFNATLLVTVGSLFYGKGFYFIPTIWIVMILLNVLSFRTFIASLLGLIVPCALTFGIYMLLNRHHEIIDTTLESLLTPAPFFVHNLYSKIYNGIMIGVIIISSIVLLGKLNKMKIVTRKLNRVFIWMVIYALLLAITPFFSMEIIPIIAIGTAYLIAQYFEAVKSTFWQEAWFTLLIVITTAMQWLVN